MTLRSRITIPEYVPGNMSFLGCLDDATWATFRTSSATRVQWLYGETTMLKMVSFEESFVGKTYDFQVKNGDSKFSYQQYTLFGTYAQTQPMVLFGRMNRVSLFTSGCWRFESFSVEDEHDIILDLISVRFTNESEISERTMYDRVSKSLFRNAGKGMFEICPDIGNVIEKNS